MSRMEVWTALLLLGTSVSAQEGPRIEADASGIKFAVQTGMIVGLQESDGNVQEFATLRSVDSAIAGMVSTVEARLSSAMVRNISSLRAEISSVADDQSDLDAIRNQLSNATASIRRMMTSPTMCSVLSAPLNGNIMLPVEALPGTVATYSCEDGYNLDGLTSDPVCLSSGQWSWSGTPRCVPIAQLGSQANPANSCKQIWLDKQSRLEPSQSGTYHITYGGESFTVFCDMDTVAADGASGWTLCAKYDAGRGGDAYSQWLSNGFGRANIGVGDMAVLDQFTAVGKRWSSIDCRPLVNMDSKYFMHAGANRPNSSNFNAIKFTNIMIDARLNSTHLFDTSTPDGETGTCVAREQGGIQSYNRYWIDLTDIGELNRGEGACMLGNGYHFCGAGRDGYRFSNAGTQVPSNGNPNCGGSQDDTVFWAWETDDHGCASGVIGTGCRGQRSRYRYNYLLIH